MALLVNWLSCVIMYKLESLIDEDMTIESFFFLFIVSES